MAIFSHRIATFRKQTCLRATRRAISGWKRKGDEVATHTSKSATAKTRTQRKSIFSAILHSNVAFIAFVLGFVILLPFIHSISFYIFASLAASSSVGSRENRERTLWVIVTDYRACDQEHLPNPSSVTRSGEREATNRTTQ